MITIALPKGRIAKESLELFSKMFGSNNTLNIELSTMMKLYEEILQLIIDDVGGQYFIDNIKSNNKRVSLSSLSFDSPIVIRDDRFEFIFRLLKDYHQKQEKQDVKDQE